MEDQVPTTTSTETTPTETAPDYSGVVETEPAHTGSEPVKEAPAQPVAETTEPETTEPTETQPAESTEPAAEEAPAPATEPEQQESILDLMGQQKYQETETNIDIFDEYGNLDPQKFASFLAENNKNVAEKAVSMMTATSKAQEMEETAWDKVYTDNPELKDNPTLEKALRGARIQDLVDGGDGDLSRLAKDLVAPLRTSQIKAQEDVARTVEDQEALSVTTPKNATTEPVQKSNMVLLREAISAGDTDRANQIRHAIRKERIYGKDS